MWTNYIHMDVLNKANNSKPVTHSIRILPPPLDHTDEYDNIILTSMIKIKQDTRV